MTGEIWEKYIIIEPVGSHFTVKGIDNRIIFGTFNTYGQAMWVARNRYKDTEIWKDEQFEKIVLVQ